MFVLRSYPRCGTHMVRTALAQHPEITIHNEIFNPDVLPAAEIQQLGAAGLFQKYTGLRTGFCVHGYTEQDRVPLQKHTLELWDLLKATQPPMLILERRDLLRRAFSVARARRTQRWHHWKTQKQAAAQTTPVIPASEVVWNIDRALAAFAYGRAHFPWAKFYNYEDLTTQWDTISREVQELVGVTSVRTLAPLTAKQDMRRISDIVSNYSELRAVFAGTKYESYFQLAEAEDERQHEV